MNKKKNISKSNFYYFSQKMPAITNIALECPQFVVVGCFGMHVLLHQF